MLIRWMKSVGYAWLIVAAFAACSASKAETIREHWVGSWSASMTLLQPPFVKGVTGAYSDVTFRNVVHLSLGGDQIRLTLSNQYGPLPLYIGGVHVGLDAGKGAIVPDSDHEVTFDGGSTVRIPSGSIVVSDPITFNVPAFSNLAVSVYIPGENVGHLTFHALAASTNYVADGDMLSSISLTNPKSTASWFIVSGIEVLSDADASTVVTLGDSITDGVHSAANENTRWPDLLAKRLHIDKRTAHIGVLNAGISGNQLLNNGSAHIGINALARFNWDVLGQTGVKYLIILEGINDIGRLSTAESSDLVITDAKNLEEAFEQLATRAHAHGIKVFVATLTPYRGATYYSPQGEEIRQKVNIFIRNCKTFDAVIDFDKTVRDPDNLDRLRPEYDSGDHLHPGPGYKAMADSINLSLFK